MSIDNSGPKPGDPRIEVNVIGGAEEEQDRGVTIFNFADLPVDKEDDEEEGDLEEAIVDEDDSSYGMFQRVIDESAPIVTSRDTSPSYGNIITPGLEDRSGDTQRDEGERQRQEWERRQIEQQISDRVRMASKVD